MSIEYEEKGSHNVEILGNILASGREIGQSLWDDINAPVISLIPFGVLGCGKFVNGNLVAIARFYTV